MTIEQKAKAYDAALEKAKNLQHDNAWVTTIFPELKDSEDERMRKAALKGIEFLEMELGWDAIGDTDILDVKEYLEKQKEQEQPEVDLFERPETPIKEAIEVTSRMQHIDDDIKPIAEFILDYASWNLHKDEWNQPVIEVPLFRVLDALVQRGKPYCCAG